MEPSTPPIPVVVAPLPVSPLRGDREKTETTDGSTPRMRSEVNSRRIFISIPGTEIAGSVDHSFRYLIYSLFGIIQTRAIGALNPSFQQLFRVMKFL